MCAEEKERERMLRKCRIVFMSADMPPLQHPCLPLGVFKIVLNSTTGDTFSHNKRFDLSDNIREVLLTYQQERLVLKLRYILESRE